MAEPPSPPDRPDLYVVARFLDRLCEPGAAFTRSRLQAAVRLNYDLFRSYLGWLDTKGLVVTTNEKGKEIIRISPAGLEAHHQLVGWLRRMLGDALR